MENLPPSIPDHHVLTNRLAGFVDLLRLNDFNIGPNETVDVAELISSAPLDQLNQVRLKLKILLSARRDEWERFDDLFEAYWMSHGRERQFTPSHQSTSSDAAGGGHGVWRAHLSSDQTNKDHVPPAHGEEDGIVQTGDADGRLIASTQKNRNSTDFRKLVDPEEITQAEHLAFKLARSMRNRLSRRYRRAKNGIKLDFRKTIRANQCHGGDQLTLIKKSRRDRPVRVVIILDVSGSMKTYSRFFLQFVKGLVGQWVDTDAYVFHTKLIRVTGAFRDKNTLKAMTRLSLMVDGFGGGTKLGDSLDQLNSVYAKQAINSRSVVFIISDGYDTGSAENLSAQLARLKKRARRLVWLNPMLGWRDYQPITTAMAAAMPHIDHFAAANTLESLAAIEPHLKRM